MDLVSIDSSKVVMLAHLVRKSGQLFRPLGVAALRDRYRFQGVPATLEEMNASPTLFKHGVFRDIAIEQVDIYNDGLVVSSGSNTNEIDNFLEDFLAWAENDLGVSAAPEFPISRRYESNIVVKMDIVFDRLMPWGHAVQSYLGGKLQRYGLQQPPFDFPTVRLMPTGESRTGFPPFLLEPKVNAPPGSGLYFSVAPLKTDDHVEMLRGLESSLVG